MAGPEQYVAGGGQVKWKAGLAILLVPLAIYLVVLLSTPQGAFWLDWAWKAVVVALLFDISIMLRRRE